MSYAIGIYYSAYKHANIPEWLYKILKAPTTDYFIKWNTLYYRAEDDKEYKEYELPDEEPFCEGKRPESIDLIDESIH